MSSAYCDTLHCLLLEPRIWTPFMPKSCRIAWPKVSTTRQHNKRAGALSNPSLEWKRRGKPAVIYNHGWDVCVNNFNPAVEIRAKIKSLENTLQEIVITSIKSLFLVKADDGCRQLFMFSEINRVSNILCPRTPQVWSSLRIFGRTLRIRFDKAFVAIL